MNIDNFFKIVYEDKNLLVIDKKDNIIIFPVKKKLNNTLFDIIINFYPSLYKIQNRGIVHRLDKDTTGLLIIAKDEHSYITLKNYFFKRKIFKKYIAIVSGEIITGGVINKYICRNIKNRKKMCINNYNYGKYSLTNYRIIKKLYLHTLVSLFPETGRTHQIRLHMSYINHPIIGDKKYKNNSSNYKKSLFFLNKNNIIVNRHALHSYKLIFNHPITKKIVKIKSNIPDDINDLINKINIYSNL